MISVISDVHIKSPDDEPYELFLRFLNHETVSKSDKIIFLGDIFDLLIGGDLNFIKSYKVIFDKLRSFLDQGIEIYYLEGNHDFHLEAFFTNLYADKKFIHSEDMIRIKNGEKTILFCHGDDIEIENPSYKRYSKFIKSNLIKILAEKIVPFSFTQKIGVWASSRSRKKNIVKYKSQSEEIRSKFRRSAEIANKKMKVDVIVAGHSHVKDEYFSEEGFLYLNNGFFPEEKTFLVIKEGSHEFIDLSEPSR